MSTPRALPVQYSDSSFRSPALFYCTSTSSFAPHSGRFPLSNPDLRPWASIWSLVRDQDRQDSTAARTPFTKASGLVPTCIHPHTHNTARSSYLRTMSSAVLTPPVQDVGLPLPSIVVDHATSPRAEPPRRADTRVRKSSFQTVQALASVPEDSSSHPRPSLRPGSSSNATSRHSSSWKGKENEVTRTPGLSRGVSGESVQSARRRRADWVVDLLETRKGSEAWVERDRVVLVTGSESLCPSSGTNDIRSRER